VAYSGIIGHKGQKKNIGRARWGIIVGRQFELVKKFWVWGHQKAVSKGYVSSNISTQFKLLIYMSPLNGLFQEL